MSRRVSLWIPLDVAAEPLAAQVEHGLRGAASAPAWRLLRRSLDTRKGRAPGVRLELEVAASRAELSPATPPWGDLPRWPPGRPVPRVVVVGSGPAGTWAALSFARMGLSCTVLEQGKPVQPRRRDLANLHRGQLDPTSNYCFGEGGAGTYSDGKLYTRTKDRARVAAVLADLVRFGAPPEIAFESRPHVGSNRLPRVLSALREHLCAQGVSYRFETAFAGLVQARGRVRAVRTAAGDELPADLVVLAVGHSARAVYAQLLRDGVALARKPFAVGVRMEHPQPVVDRMQYGELCGHPALPPAFYELKARSGERGVYSFCMCPGGWIVPAATEPDGVVVNGMSLSRRDSPFANSGLVVSVSERDVGPDGAGVLAGLAFQRAIETASFAAGGGGFRTGAQRLPDFLRGRDGADLPRTSYRPGVAPARLSAILPPFVARALHEGLSALCARHRALHTPEAILVAAETRTSSPVRVLRDPHTLESPSLAGLYPVGEGAGYAGGIVSAALDGARAAEAAVRARL